MKTIVIRPEVIGYHNSAFKEPQRPLNKSAIACAFLIPVVAFAGWMAGHLSVEPKSATAVAAVSAKPQMAPVKVEPLPAPLASSGAMELQAAIEHGLVNADFTSNGRDQVLAEIANPGSNSAKIRLSFGQVLECGRNTVVVTRSAETQVAAGKTVTLNLPTVATRSGNRFGPATYRLSTRTVPKIDLLLTYAQDHPELSPGALQTASLILTENLPLSSLCKFTPAGNDLPTRFDTSAFRAETLDLITALSVLREIGVRDRDLAVTVDPQLKIEAMIDPACHGVAMTYYGLNNSNEWAYWKNELLTGNPATRHYALVGIGRYYPEVALEMLPTWAREKRTTQILRRTAVQALAETKRPEALALLEQLVDDLGRNTELGRYALDAAQTLYATLAKRTSTPNMPSVAFRSSTGSTPF